MQPNAAGNDAGSPHQTPARPTRPRRLQPGAAALALVLVAIACGDHAIALARE